MLLYFYSLKYKKINNPIPPNLSTKQKTTKKSTSPSKLNEPYFLNGLFHLAKPQSRKVKVNPLRLCVFARKLKNFTRKLNSPLPNQSFWKNTSRQLKSRTIQCYPPTTHNLPFELSQK